MSEVVSEFSIDVDVLREMVAIVGKFVPNKATMPALMHVRIVYLPESKRLAMTGTDFDAGMAVAVPCREPSAPFDLAVNAKMLAEYLGLVAGVGGKVAIRHLQQGDGKANRLYMEIGGFKLNTNALTGDSCVLVHVSERFSRAGFPLAEPMSAELDPRYWSTIGRVAVAAAADESRPILATVCTRVAGGVAEMACTDGYRLAFRSGVQLAGIADGEYLVPASVLQKAQKLMEGLVDQRVYAGNTSNAATHQQDVSSFVWSGHDPRMDMWVDFSARRADGSFPNYMAIVPKNDVISFCFDAPEALLAIRVANLFSRENAFRVDLALDGDTAVQLDSVSAEMGDSKAKVPVAKMTGSEADRAGFKGITFNGKYLKDALDGHHGPVRIGLLAPNKPAIFNPVGDDSFNVVVMPMMKER